MSDPNQERVLRPIYAFLDSYNYTKALKLTYSKPQCNWPITIALRAHCLERSGRKLDACRELRILVCALSRTTSNSSRGSGNDDLNWCELDELIWILGLGSKGEKSTVGMADSSSSGNSGSGASSGGGGGNSSSGGKGKKGKGKSVSSKSKPSSSSASTSNSNKTKVEKAPLDLIHILDLPQYKRQEILSSSKYIEGTFTDTNTLKTEEVLDGVSGQHESMKIAKNNMIQFD